MKLVTVLVVVLALSQRKAHSATTGIGIGISDEEWNNDAVKSQFKDGEAFEKFKEFYRKGLLGRDQSFNLRDPKARDEAAALAQLLSSADNSMQMLGMSQRLEGMMNYEQLLYSVTVGVLNFLEKNNETGPQPGFSMPGWQDILSNYFVPKSIMDEMDRKIKQGDLENDFPLIAPEESDWATYMTEDPVLNSNYYNWQIIFPTWADPEKMFLTKVENRGKLYYDFHRQLVANYYLKTTVDGQPWNWHWDDKDIKAGYKSELTNYNGRPIVSRVPMTPAPQNRYLKELKEIAARYDKLIYINDSYTISVLDEDTDRTRELVSNLIFNTTESGNPQYYRSYYDAAVEYLASVGSEPSEDGGGAAGYPLTALRDPAYYAAIDRINSINEVAKASSAYQREELQVEDVTIDSLEVGRLETFFETFTINVKKAKEDGELIYYKVELLRMNHNPFAMKLNFTNRGQQNRSAVVTIIMGFPDILKSPHNISHYYQIMDRFLVEIKPGDNVIDRNFNDSLIFDDEHKMTMKCSIPKNLALPKGTAEGRNMTMIGFVSPFDESGKEDPSIGKEELLRSPLCGNLRLNYGLAFGFPLDKKLPENVDYVQTLTPIYHQVRTFRGGITI